MSYYDEVKQELTNLISAFEKSNKRFDEAWAYLEKRGKVLEQEKEIIKQMARERQIGFPTLAKAYEDFFELQDKAVTDFMKFKDKPAIAASEVVSEFSKQRRKAEKEKKILQYIIDYYETIAPFLIELKEEIADVTEQDKELLADYSEEELEDKATNYLTKEEYRKLPTVERNQMALDRYWKRPKSKWHIGKIYERYVGYLFEAEDYDVEYVGIFKGLEDLGRDIIARKGDELVIVQCKNWSQFKTIFEKHIFQFFGTVFQYKDENKDVKVRAIFYTTTKLSDLARRFAQELGIELKEEYKMQTDYPCIKCNVSGVGGTKIYHLPFDQQYDKVKIEKNKGEFYCKTVAEAEGKGFRRAFRYKGLVSNQE